MSVVQPIPFRDPDQRRFEQIIGNSPALETVLEQVKRVAPTSSTVLLLGETGTGKELFARSIHNVSARCGRPFVKLNCSAIPFELLESELFGHEKGAFTGAIAQKKGRFELADGGTLFLDEIGDFPLASQPKLLRVLQEQEFERLGSCSTIRVDVRLVAATHRDLAEMAKKSTFRNDLYYRLNVFPLALPALRERREDILPLVRHFVEKFSRRIGKTIDDISQETLAAFESYDWPGNIRELQNLIERAIILSNDGFLPNLLTPGIVEPPITNSARPIATAAESMLTHQNISNMKDEIVNERLDPEEDIQCEMNLEQIIGNSAALKQTLELVATVAPSEATVLLLGETGTGKELIARAIHNQSRRRCYSLVKLNCTAITPRLLESELFGHEKGAFTGAIAQKIGRLELADQGTLFLDEVGDVPAEIQSKLLRALKEREFERLGTTDTRTVNVRLIAATNRDLEKMVADKEFRSDLYYRLHVFPIRIPPLRERKDDIPLLVRYFVRTFSKRMQKRIEAIPEAVMEGLAAWDWPGNIRELENFIERAVILTHGTVLQAPLAELRKPNNREALVSTMDSANGNVDRTVKNTIDAMTLSESVTGSHIGNPQEEIVRALTESRGRVGGVYGAAVRMGIKRTTLIARMKKLGIDSRQYAC